MTHRVVIIGAGPGGLATAMLLARAGLDVTVLERHAEVGGRAASFAIDGFRFDRGPTFFHYPRILSDIFRECGFDLLREVQLTRLDPQYRLVFGTGGRLDATACIEQMEAQISELSPRDVGGFRALMTENRHKFGRFSTIMQRPFLGLRDLVRSDTLKALPLLRPWRSLHQDVGRFFKDERLKLAFTFQGKYLGMSPFQCPSLFSILSFLEYEHGVFHPTGGCGAVAQVMARLARQLGAQIRCGETVTKILFDGRRATGVKSTNATHTCDSIIVNADFARAMTDLVPDHVRRRWTNRRISAKKFSCSTFMLYLGLKGTQHHLPHHMTYLSGNYAQNLRDIEEGRLPADPSVYVQNACVTDSTLAPAGCSTLYVLAPVPHQTSAIDWNQEKHNFRRVILRQLAKLGIDDVESRITCEMIYTPVDWEASGIYLGATFNLAHTLGQMLHLRPRNRFEDLEAVYLVGGGTHPGSGLPTIYSSARITSKLLLEDMESTAKAKGRQTPKPTVAAAVVTSN